MHKKARQGNPRKEKSKETLKERKGRTEEPKGGFVKGRFGFFVTLVPDLVLPFCLGANLQTTLH